MLTYQDLDVQLERATPRMAELVDLAAQHCFKHPQTISAREKTHTLVRYLLSADHTSPFEHCVFTFRINNFSRSGLAQLTRHRMAGYTVTSQHYQEYSDYPFIVQNYNPRYERAFQVAIEEYKALIAEGVDKSEARQVLPNAMGCALVMTINARSLINFFRQRLCKRNCAEILNLAQRMLTICTQNFPQLFAYVHAPCVMDHGCNQGRMSCGKPYQLG